MSKAIYIKIILKKIANIKYTYFESLKRYINNKENLNFDFKFDYNSNSIIIKKEFKDIFINYFQKDYPDLIDNFTNFNIEKSAENYPSQELKDVTKHLFNLKIIYKGNTEGTIIESQIYKEIKFLIHKIINKYLAKELSNLKEFDVPSSIDKDTIIKTGYIDKFSDLVLAISKLDLNSKSSQKYKLAPFSSFLSPTICFRIFPLIKIINEENIDKYKNNIDKEFSFLSSGKCFRNEIFSNNLSLSRLNEFDMMEYILIGERDLILERKSLLSKKLISLFKELGINKFKIKDANDAFFIGAYNKFSNFQDLFKLKQEFLIDIDSEPLSFVSLNLHQNSMIKAFDILNLVNNKWENPESVCIGIGLDRLILILNSIYDCDSNLIKNKLINIDKII